MSCQVICFCWSNNPCVQWTCSSFSQSVTIGITLICYMKKVRLRKGVSEIPEVKTQENEELGLGFESQIVQTVYKTLGSSFLLI